MVKAGAMPKLAKSLKESNSAPKGLVAFKSLAIRPSSPSIIAAIKVQYTALSQRASMANLIALMPITSPISVKKLGTNFIIGTGLFNLTLLNFNKSYLGYLCIRYA